VDETDFPLIYVDYPPDDAVDPTSEDQFSRPVSPTPRKSLESEVVSLDLDPNMHDI